MTFTGVSMGAMFALLVLVLLLMSGVFAMVEMAVFSTRRERLRQLARQGDRRGLVVLAFLRSPTRVLLSLQLATTLIGILVGALGEIGLNQPTASLLQSWGLSAQVAGNLAFWIVVISSTLFSMVFASALPKKTGWVKADEVAIFFAWPLRAWTALLSPGLRALGWITDSIANRLGIRVEHEELVTEADLKTLMESGQKRGQLEPLEMEIVHQALNLSDIQVSEVMTPAERAQWLDAGRGIPAMSERLVQTGHSYLPVGRGSLDQPCGVIRSRDWLVNPPATEADWERMLLPFPAIPGSASILDLLTVLREHPAKVVRVTGPEGTCGIVTQDDLLRSVIRGLR